MPSSAVEINTRILRALRMEGGPLTSSQIARRLGTTMNRIRGRLRYLITQGAVIKLTEDRAANDVGYILNKDWRDDAA